MTSYRGKLAMLLGAACLSGCFGGGSDDDAYQAPPMPVRQASALPSQLPAERGTNHVETQAGQQAQQCVPYAREHSTIKISGDANTWWSKAAGKYERGSAPAAGAVMVLFNYSNAGSGHVAVVRRVVSAREIRIDHANWLDDGSIYVNDPVVDVSEANDWSKVKVWNIKTGSWGTKSFPVQGFIGSGSNRVPDGSNAAPRGDDEAAPQDDLVAKAAPDDVDDAAPVQRVAVAVPPRPRLQPQPQSRLKSLRTVAVKKPQGPINPVIPAAMTTDDRNPAPDSGFALTDEDRAIP